MILTKRMNLIVGELHVETAQTTVKINFVVSVTSSFASHWQLVWEPSILSIKDWTVLHFSLFLLFVVVVVVFMHPKHMEVSWPGIKSEFQVWPTSRVQHCQILNPLWWGPGIETMPDPQPAVPQQELPGSAFYPRLSPCKILPQLFLVDWPNIHSLIFFLCLLQYRGSKC